MAKLPAVDRAGTRWHVDLREAITDIQHGRGDAQIQAAIQAAEARHQEVAEELEKYTESNVAEDGIQVRPIKHFMMQKAMESMGSSNTPRTFLFFDDEKRELRGAAEAVVGQQMDVGRREAMTYGFVDSMPRTCDVRSKEDSEKMFRNPGGTTLFVKTVTAASSQPIHQALNNRADYATYTMKAYLHHKARQEFVELQSMLQNHDLNARFTRWDGVYGTATQAEANGTLELLKNWEFVFNLDRSAAHPPVESWQRLLYYAIKANKPNLLVYGFAYYPAVMEWRFPDHKAEFWSMLWQVLVQDAQNLELVKIMQAACTRAQCHTSVDLFFILGRCSNNEIFDYLLQQNISNLNVFNIDDLSTYNRWLTDTQDQALVELHVVCDRWKLIVKTYYEHTSRQRIYSSGAGVLLGAAMVGVAHYCGLELYISMPVLAVIGLGTALWREASSGMTLNKPGFACAALQTGVFGSVALLPMLQAQVVEAVGTTAANLALEYQLLITIVSAAAILTVAQLAINALEKVFIDKAQAPREIV